MKTFRAVVVAFAVMSLLPSDALATGGKRGSSGARSSAPSGRSSSSARTRSPGTGSSRSNTTVRSYTKSSGTRVDSHHRTTPDGGFSNNYSTKGNTNPYTGKAGTRTTPSRRP
jgi:hypothetical protein